MKNTPKGLLVVLGMALTINVFAQAPAITYNTPKAKVTATLPFSISPVNTGGAVPARQYGQVSTFAGDASNLAGTMGYVNGNGTAALFNNPQDMAFDAAGNMYLTDAGNNAIRKITPDGTVSTYAGSTTGVAGLVDGQDTTARFDFPDGLAFDAAGNLFVADFNNAAIRKITPAGVVSTFYTSTTDVFSPTGMCFDASGNLVIALQYNFEVVKLSPTAVLSVVAGIDYNFQTPAGVVPDSAILVGPTDVKMDKAGNLFIADGGGYQIEKITPDGKFSLFAGNRHSTLTYGNGIGSQVGLAFPAGIQIMRDGSMYITEIQNNDIRKMLPNGTVSAFSGVVSLYPAGDPNAGSAIFQPGFVDGPLSAAQYYEPAYPRADNNGDLYVSEWGQGGNRIRKILMSGYSLNGTLPAGLTFDATTGTISGTVTTPFAAQKDTITAHNINGSSSAIVTLSYQPLSAIATLTSLVPGSGTLSPAFASGTTNYTDAVSSSTTGITITPTTADTTATVTVNGTPVASGTASGNIPVAVGSNTITTVVTADDGTDSKTYIITVTRAASNDAKLVKIAANTGTALTAVTGPGYQNYATSVPNTTASVAITATVQDAAATIAVNGIAATSGVLSSAIALAVGANVINTVVTAADGITKLTYTITITRAPAGSTNALLTKIATNSGIALTTVTGPDYKDYSLNVPGTTSSITVTPTTQDATATVKINGTTVASGTPSAAIPLPFGNTVINTVVTAQDGITTKTYSITVTRLSNNALLTKLATNSGAALNAVTGPDYKDYTLLVTSATSSIAVTPTAQDAGATITVNGTTVASGTASAAIALPAGNTVINTVVTAQDGVTIKTYNITVTRPSVVSNNALLTKIATNSGVALTAVSGPDYKDYTINVPNSIVSITVTPTTQDPGATVKVDGTTVTSGTASPAIPLPVGSTTITTVVTAQDGTTTKTYGITVTRAVIFSLYKPVDSVAADGLTVHPGITPNGDGINDIFTIDGINTYPDNKVTIMNRSGAVVYEAKGYDNQTKFFDGHSNKNGTMQLPGTYFYSLEYSSNGKTKVKTGFLVLKY